MPSVRKLVLIGDTLLTLFDQMARLRCCEEQTVELVRTGKLPPAIRPIYGLEAVAAGLAWHLRSDDLLFGPDYCRSLALAKGVDAGRMFGQWLQQRPNSVSSLRVVNSQRARFDASGYVGAGVLAKPSLRHAAGAALGFRQQQRDSIAAVVFPAHLIGSGAFHESVRLAQAESLPVLFVCDHSLPPTAPPAQRLSLRVRAYGLPCVFVDALDISETYAAASDAVNRARTEGPSFLEFATQCFDPMQFGSAEMEHTALQEWAPQDPLSCLHDRLLDDHGVALSDLNRRMSAAQQEIVEALSDASS